MNVKLGKQLPRFRIHINKFAIRTAQNKIHEMELQNEMFFYQLKLNEEIVKTMLSPRYVPMSFIGHRN